MKKFENPAIELSIFAVEDVVTTSETLGDNETGTIPGGLQGGNATRAAENLFGN